MNLLEPRTSFRQRSKHLGKRFGHNAQLEVIGELIVEGRAKQVVRCEECASDEGLFGEGLFYISATHLLSGRVPCGCASSPRWDEWQWEVMIERKCKELGYMFKGWVGDFKGNSTYLNLTCHRHGTWQTSTITNLLDHGKGCTQCGWRTTGLKIRHEDARYINLFRATGKFHPETTFKRTERVNSRGHRLHWEMDCPDCGTRGEALAGSFAKGMRSCLCAFQNQREAYIQILYDGSLAVAAKFGISNNTKNRTYRFCVFDYKCLCIYDFEDKRDCLAAEAECLEVLDCGIINRRDMPNGWSETTSLTNLDTIQAIYRKHGGKLRT